MPSISCHFAYNVMILIQDENLGIRRVCILYSSGENQRSQLHFNKRKQKDSSASPFQMSTSGPLEGVSKARSCWKMLAAIAGSRPQTKSTQGQQAPSQDEDERTFFASIRSPNAMNDAETFISTDATRREKARSLVWRRREQSCLPGPTGLTCSLMPFSGTREFDV
ncbi:hypothetical protein AC579_10625 [Pseudocercospora musae]|uniref:Uncharacterized protein n=1 Tax=Pseudocercospora musae TaxID=113226 RepID=A0A139ILN1_9PEZI|nr:hypothetical protein AC579_10625 [Pseudocercospora musae]